MSWLFYSLTTVVLFALWSVLGKIALRTATPVQTTLLYGLAGIAVALAAIAARPAHGGLVAGRACGSVW